MPCCTSACQLLILAAAMGRIAGVTYRPFKGPYRALWQGARGQNKKNRPGPKNNSKTGPKGSGMGPRGSEMPRIEFYRPSEPLKLSCDPDQARFLKKASEEKYFSDRPAILARFPENRRMPISRHRPGKAKSVQPVGFVLASYIGRTQFHAIWSRDRPISS